MKIHIVTVVSCMLWVAACTTIGTVPVTFVTEPKTSEEHAVAQRLESLITTYNNREIDKHVAHYAPNATIDSRVAGDVVSREEYRQALHQSPSLPTVEFRKAKIMTVSSERSHVETVVYALGSQGSNTYAIFFNLIRSEGQWLIIEQRYR